MRVAGKVALISGGSRGIGAATAELLAEEGAAVVIGDVLREEGLKTQSRINEGGGRCTFLDLDVTSESDWAQVVASAVSTYGKLDVLVNNAGISGRTRVEETDGELWDRVMAINAKGVFLGTKARSRRCETPGEDQLSTFRPSTASSAARPPPHTTVPRARCGC